MRLLMTGGGTGGHVYPALTVLESFKSQVSSFRSGDSEHGTGNLKLETVWVGSVDGIERDLVTRAGVPFEGIAAAGLRGLAPWTVGWNLLKLGRGFAQAGAILKRFRPDVILATGGYVSVPVVMAGWVQRVPSLVFLPDIEPGWAIRFLSRFANRIAVSFGASRRWLPASKVMETGYPVRPELLALDRETARKRLGFAVGSVETAGGLPSQPVLLIFGGSRGAHRINQAAYDAADALAQLAQVVHVTGGEDAAWLQARRDSLAEELKNRYHVFPYLHDEMPAALASADLVVARAGAATLGEFPAAGLPAILVPYPYSGQHQMPNARYLADAGAAVIVPDGELTGARLTAEVGGLLRDPARLLEMRQKAKRLARPAAARRIGEELMQLAESRGVRR